MTTHSPFAEMPVEKDDITPPLPGINYNQIRPWEWMNSYNKKEKGII
jgi:hypothetical protein